MRVTRHAAGLATVAIVATGALTLGVAAPANAAIYNLADYAPTLPWSVIDTLPDEEQRAWQDQTRAGTITKPVVPIGPAPTYSNPTTKLPGILGAAAYLVEIGGQAQMQYSYSDDLWWKNADRPDWIPADEWDACSGGGDASNFWDGLRDWTASLQGALTGGGYDCAAIREDWVLPVDEDYEPVGNVSDPLAHYPFSVVSNGVTVTLGSPKYSTATYVYQTGITRQEGWVIPLTFTGGGTNDPLLRLYPDLVTPSGVVSYSQTTTPGVIQRNPGAVYASAQGCGTGAYCLVLDKYFGSVTGLPSNWRATDSIATIGAYNIWQTSPKPLVAPLPYVNPMTGSYVPEAGLQDQVMVTTVTTAAGNRYSCATAPFKEDAPTIPRPCEPAVPEWEVETERITELVPLKDYPTHVPYTQPGREIQKVVKPAEIVEWAESFPDCDEQVCKVFLMWIDAQGTEVNCYDRPEECEGWYTRADKETKFKCRYGTNLATAALLALAECTQLAQLFEQGAVENGQAYPDPAKDPASSPGGQTSTAPAPATPPGSGPGNPEQTRQCWPTGWGMFNPFEWVYLPVKCALEWAFVPRQSAINNGNGQIHGAWNNSVIRQFAMSLETLLAALPDDGGCGGIPLNVTLPGGVQVSETLLNSCGPPLAAAAATTKSILTGSIIVATVLACSRYLAVIFGFVGYGQVIEQRAAEKAERKGKGNLT